MKGFSIFALLAWADIPSLSFAFSVRMTSSSLSSPASTIPKIPTARHTLYDVKVSNNGARCRLILYKKNLSSTEVDIRNPSEIGGLRSPEFLALNPQGKMPLLVVNDGDQDKQLPGSIPESDTICRHLLSTYETGPSFLPNNTRSNLLARLHDMYLTTVQGCIYKASPPFGIFGSRKEAIDEFQRQLLIIDDIIGTGITDGVDNNDAEGLSYLCGSEVSLADATLFPTMVFAEMMLPKFGRDEALPPNIRRWYDNVRAKDTDFAKIYDEVVGGIQQWENNGRWDSIWLAGRRDDEEPTIFDKIISGEIPSKVIREDASFLAFADINPAAPAHVLVIPKDRAGLSCLRKSSQEHIEILGRLMVFAGEIAGDQDLGFGDGARIVINDGKEAGQEVPHLHVHVLSGREMSWPPG